MRPSPNQLGKLWDRSKQGGAYRGYLIKPVGLGGCDGFIVTKAGEKNAEGQTFTICHGKTVRICEASIDALLGGPVS